ncbi:MAG: DUF4386 domain-containing protein [Janthinobacterium lividum]
MNLPPTTSLQTAALVGGLMLLLLVLLAPFAELYAYPKFLVPGNGTETVRHLLAQPGLLVATIGAYLVTFLGDVVLAWAFYVLLAPVQAHLALLAAWLRLVFAIIGLVALLNLVSVFRLLTEPAGTMGVAAAQVPGQVLLYLTTFRYYFHFGIFFFSLHLGLLGYLVLRAPYVPTWLGALLLLAGAGYLTSALRPFLFPSLNMQVITCTYFGELLFMGWLLLRGWRIAQPA